jgi:transcriptional regulator with XRE-family HTH domain
MDLQEAKEVIKSRCLTKRQIAEEIKVSENHLHRILSGGINSPHPLVEEAIINWAKKQESKEIER